MGKKIRSAGYRLTVTLAGARALLSLLALTVPLQLCCKTFLEMPQFALLGRILISPVAKLARGVAAEIRSCSRIGFAILTVLVRGGAAQISILLCRLIVPRGRTFVPGFSTVFLVSGIGPRGLQIK